MSILAYHLVDPRFNWGVTRVTPRQFAGQIKFLIDQQFAIQTISDYLTSPSTDIRRVAITFDDGYESVYTYALPILQKHGVTASVFINPAYMGQFNTWDVNSGRRFRHMNWSQVAELRANGWEIGPHGMRHRDLTRLSAQAIEWELTLSAALIERKIGACSSVFSYPFGNTNAVVAFHLHKWNYKYGLSMGMSNKNLSLQYAINRTGIYLFDDSAIFRCKVHGQFRFVFRTLQKIMDLCSDLTVLCRLSTWTAD